MGYPITGSQNPWPTKPTNQIHSKKLHITSSSLALNFEKSFLTGDRWGCGETKSICASHEKRQFEIVAKPRGKAIKA